MLQSFYRQRATQQLDCCNEIQKNAVTELCTYVAEQLKNYSFHGPLANINAFLHDSRLRIYLRAISSDEETRGKILDVIVEGIYKSENKHSSFVFRLERDRDGLFDEFARELHEEHEYLNAIDWQDYDYSNDSEVEKRLITLFRGSVAQITVPTSTKPVRKVGISSGLTEQSRYLASDVSAIFNDMSSRLRSHHSLVGKDKSHFFPTATVDDVTNVVKDPYEGSSMFDNDCTEEKFLSLFKNIAHYSEVIKGIPDSIDIPAKYEASLIELIPGFVVFAPNPKVCSHMNNFWGIMTRYFEDEYIEDILKPSFVYFRLAFMFGSFPKRLIGGILSRKETFHLAQYDSIIVSFLEMEMKRCTRATVNHHNPKLIAERYVPDLRLYYKFLTEFIGGKKSNKSTLWKDCTFNESAELLNVIYNPDVVDGPFDNLEVYPPPDGSLDDEPELDTKYLEGETDENWSKEKLDKVMLYSMHVIIDSPAHLFTALTGSRRRLLEKYDPTGKFRIKYMMTQIEDCRAPSSSEDQLGDYRRNMIAERSRVGLARGMMGMLHNTERYEYMKKYRAAVRHKTVDDNGVRKATEGFAGFAALNSDTHRVHMPINATCIVNLGGQGVIVHGSDVQSVSARDAFLSNKAMTLAKSELKKKALKKALEVNGDEIIRVPDSLIKNGKKWSTVTKIDKARKAAMSENRRANNVKKKLASPLAKKLDGVVLSVPEEFEEKLQEFGVDYERNEDFLETVYTEFARCNIGANLRVFTHTLLQHPDTGVEVTLKDFRNEVETKPVVNLAEKLERAKLKEELKPYKEAARKVLQATNPNYDDNVQWLNKVGPREKKYWDRLDALVDVETKLDESEGFAALEKHALDSVYSRNLVTDREEEFVRSVSYGVNTTDYAEAMLQALRNNEDDSLRFESKQLALDASVEKAHKRAATRVNTIQRKHNVNFVPLGSAAPVEMVYDSTMDKWREIGQPDFAGKANVLFRGENSFTKELAKKAKGYIKPTPEDLFYRLDKNPKGGRRKLTGKEIVSLLTQTDYSPFGGKVTVKLESDNEKEAFKLLKRKMVFGLPKSDIEIVTLEEAALKVHNPLMTYDVAQSKTPRFMYKLLVFDGHKKEACFDQLPFNGALFMAKVGDIAVQCRVYYTGDRFYLHSGTKLPLKQGRGYISGELGLSFSHLYQENEYFNDYTHWSFQVVRYMGTVDMPQVASTTSALTFREEKECRNNGEVITEELAKKYLKRKLRLDSGEREKFLRKKYDGTNDRLVHQIMKTHKVNVMLGEERAKYNPVRMTVRKVDIGEEETVSQRVWVPYVNPTENFSAQVRIGLTAGTRSDLMCARVDSSKQEFVTYVLNTSSLTIPGVLSFDGIWTLTYSKAAEEYWKGTSLNGICYFDYDDSKKLEGKGIPEDIMATVRDASAKRVVIDFYNFEMNTPLPVTLPKKKVLKNYEREDAVRRAYRNDYVVPGGDFTKMAIPEPVIKEPEVRTFVFANKEGDVTSYEGHIGKTNVRKPKLWKPRRTLEERAQEADDKKKIQKRQMEVWKERVVARKERERVALQEKIENEKKKLDAKMEAFRLQIREENKDARRQWEIRIDEADRWGGDVDEEYEDEDEDEGAERLLKKEERMAEYKRGPTKVGPAIRKRKVLNLH